MKRSPGAIQNSQKIDKNNAISPTSYNKNSWSPRGPVKPPKVSEKTEKIEIGKVKSPKKM